MFKRIGKWIGAGVALLLVLGAVGTALAQGPLPPQDGAPGGFPFGGHRGRRVAQMLCGRQPQILANGLGIEEEEVNAALANTISELAAAQGMTLDELADNILAPATERIQRAVDNGRLSQEQADEIIAQMKARLVEGLQDGTWFSWGRQPIRRRGGGVNLSVLAESLNMTEDELREALVGGKTVAEIAEEQGVALDDLVDALIAPAVERIQKRVEDGTLTQEEADQHIADLRAHILEMLENGMKPPAGRPGFGGPQPGHRWGGPY